MYIDFGKKRGRLIFTWKEFLFVATAVTAFFANVAWTQIELLKVRQRADLCEKRLIDLEGKLKKQEGKEQKKMDQDIIGGIGYGFKLLPGLVLSIETLFGRQTGETKKQAVQSLVQDAMIGATLGFGVSGNTQVAGLISGFGPIVAGAIDSIVDHWNVKGWPAASVPIPAIDPKVTAARKPLLVDPPPDPASVAQVMTQPGAGFSAHGT